jgi:hypothetical protein
LGSLLAQAATPAAAAGALKAVLADCLRALSPTTRSPGASTASSATGT